MSTTKPLTMPSQKNATRAQRFRARFAVVQVPMPHDLRDALDDIARDRTIETGHRVTRSDVIREAVERLLASKAAG